MYIYIHIYIYIYIYIYKFREKNCKSISIFPIFYNIYPTLYNSATSKTNPSRQIQEDKYK